MQVKIDHRRQQLDVRLKAHGLERFFSAFFIDESVNNGIDDVFLVEVCFCHIFSELQKFLVLQ